MATKCPECGKPMEHGYYRFMTHGVYLPVWCTEKRFNDPKREKLQGYKLNSTYYFEGERCKECRYMALKY